jgi:hypothetical protein
MSAFITIDRPQRVSCRLVSLGSEQLLVRELATL